MAVVGSRVPLAVPVDAFSNSEPDDALDHTGPLMMAAADPVVRGGRPLEQNGHHEAGADGGQDQQHPPGEPAHPVGREGNGSGRRSAIDGTSHAGTTPSARVR
ncbi:hypothetical protein [Micromonospora sp. NPDC093244]|uniref:hypothetical protein n=1 Tax=Micromonospora sp. NPDC093244 TaxID=3155071 RepID=UPI00341D70D1